MGVRELAGAALRRRLGGEDPFGHPDGGRCHPKGRVEIDCPGELVRQPAPPGARPSGGLLRPASLLPHERYQLRVPLLEGDLVPLELRLDPLGGVETGRLDLQLADGGSDADQPGDQGRTGHLSEPGPDGRGLGLDGAQPADDGLDLPLRLLSLRPGGVLVVPRHPFTAHLARLGVEGGAADRARIAVDQHGGQLEAHGVEAGLPDVGRLVAEADGSLAGLQERVAQVGGLLDEPVCERLFSGGSAQDLQLGLGLRQPEGSSATGRHCRGCLRAPLGQLRPRGHHHSQLGAGVVDRRLGVERCYLIVPDLDRDRPKALQPTDPLARSVRRGGELLGLSLLGHPDGDQPPPGFVAELHRLGVLSSSTLDVVEKAAHLSSPGGRFALDPHGEQARTVALQPVGLDEQALPPTLRGGELRGPGRAPARPLLGLQAGGALPCGSVLLVVGEEHQCVHPVLGDPLRLLGAGGLCQPGSGQRELTMPLCHRGGGRHASTREPLLHDAEPLRAEQTLQQLPTLLGLRPEELSELPLRQQDDLEELTGRHAHQVQDLFGGLLDARRHRGPGAVHLLLEQHPGLLRAGALTSPPGPVLSRGPGDAHASTGQGDLEADLGAELTRSVVGPQPGRLAPLPRDGAVEGEADRVQQRGLARSCLAVQEEQPAGPEQVEVYLDGAGERAEGGAPKSVRSHQAPAVASRPASSACSSRRRSSGSRAVRRTCSTKAAATSTSLRPATRDP